VRVPAPVWIKEPLPETIPETDSDVLTTLTLSGPPRMRLAEISEPVTPEFTVMPLVTLKLLPVKENPLEAKVIASNAVPAAKSSCVDSCDVPSKSKSSPGNGTWPFCQFAAVLQRLSAPPPTQTRSAGVTTPLRFTV